MRAERGGCGWERRGRGWAAQVAPRSPGGGGCGLAGSSRCPAGRGSGGACVLGRAPVEVPAGVALAEAPAEGVLAPASTHNEDIHLVSGRCDGDGDGGPGAPAEGSRCGACAERGLAQRRRGELQGARNRRPGPQRRVQSPKAGRTCAGGGTNEPCSLGAMPARGRTPRGAVGSRLERERTRWGLPAGRARAGAR